jgi:hypothetical protein
MDSKIGPVSEIKIQKALCYFSLITVQCIVNHCFKHSNPINECLTANKDQSHNSLVYE